MTTEPCSVGTVTLPPRKASMSVTGSAICRSSPLRSNTGCGRTWTSISASPDGPPPMPGEPLPFRRSTCPASARGMVTSTLAVGQGDRDLGTPDHLAQAHLEPVADVAAAHPHGSSTAPAAEQVLDHVLEVGSVLERAAAGIAGTARPLGEIAVERLPHLGRAAGVDLTAVELAALVLVREQVVSRGRLLEAFLGLLVAWVQIWMRGLGELAVGAADLLGRSAAGHGIS